MVNRYFSVSSYEESVEVRTLSYAYPESILLIKCHRRGDKEKVFYIRAGYFGGYILSYKSKNELPKYAQEVLRQYCNGLVKYSKDATDRSIAFAARVNSMMIKRLTDEA